MDQYSQYFHAVEAFSSLTRQAHAQGDIDMIATPDLGQHVFVKVERDLGQVQVHDDGSTHELYAGDVYILQYSIAKPLLENASIHLV